MNEHTNREIQEIGMTSEQRSRFGRRDFLRRGALFGAVAGTGSVAGGALIANAVNSAPGGGLVQLDPPSDAIDYVNMPAIRVVATDAFWSYPGRRFSALDGGSYGKGPMYGFSFRGIDNLDKAVDGGDLDANPGALIDKYKGRGVSTATTLVCVEDQEFALVVTNLGLVVRPDLDDSHSLHWHGFRNATSVFDGVPEASISVPSGRDLPYFFHPKAPSEVGQPKGSAGTYVYHCHFEDVEHVQMGMDGVIFVEPRDMWYRPDGVTAWYKTDDPVDVLEVDYAGNHRPNGRDKIAFDNEYYGVAHTIDTSFDREFALCVIDLDSTPHDNLEAVQEFVWSDFEPNYWTINGRSYPDTVIPQITPQWPADQGAFAELLQMPDFGDEVGDEVFDAEMKWQHNSSLIQCTEGERLLLRMANLGYEVHSVEFVGTDAMHVIANDASLLVGKYDNSDMTYRTRRLEMGPGENRDVILEAPAYNDADGEDDPFSVRTGIDRRFNRYILKNRNNHRNTNNGTVDPSDGVSYAGARANYGGMVTELWVYPKNLTGSEPLPEQRSINETYPTLVVPDGHV